jgi:hypothetical protein
MVPVHWHPMLADCNRLLSACTTCLGICHWRARPVLVGTDPFGSHHARAQEAGFVRQLLPGNDPSPCHASVCASASLSLCLPCFTTLFVSKFMQSSVGCRLVCWPDLLSGENGWARHFVQYFAYYPGAFGLFSFQWMCLSLTELVYLAEPCFGKSLCVAGVSVLLRVPAGSSSQAECAH